MASFTAVLTLELQAPLGFQNSDMRLSSSLAIFKIQASKLQMSGPCSQAKVPSSQCCVFAETSTMVPFTAVLTLELQPPLGIQNSDMRLSSSLAIFEIQASKLQTSGTCSQAKPASPECCVFAETSTMAPFTALLTLELQAPLGIQKLRHAT